MTTVTVVVPLKIRQWGGRKAIIAPDGAPLSPETAQSGPIPTRGDPALVKALAQAHRWRRMLASDEHGTIRELAKVNRVNETDISRSLRLTLLAPDMVEAIPGGAAAGGDYAAEVDGGGGGGVGAAANFPSAGPSDIPDATAVDHHSTNQLASTGPAAFTTMARSAVVFALTLPWISRTAP